MRLYLTGFMGSGKTTVGRSLAEALSWQFYDLDEAIEARAATSVREIFAAQGEAVFREMEHEELRASLHWDDVVVATGGGTLTFERNLEVVREAGLSVWLHPSFATIMQRIGALGKHNRPLFRDETEALNLYRNRLPAYRRADLQLAVGKEDSVEEVAARIALWLRQQACDT